MHRQTIPFQHRRAQDRYAHYSRAAFFALLRTLSLLALIVLLFGCAPVVPIVKERAAINSGDKALVLVRIRCTVDEQPFEPCIFRRSAPILSDNVFVGFAAGSFETFGAPGDVVIRALSEESFDAGWAFFVLSPGIYYLYARGPDSSEISKRQSFDYYHEYFRDVSRWQIDVPERAKLIYAGTLHLAGKIRGTLLFGDKIIDPIRSQEVPLSDDRELASRLLAKHFPDAGEVQTILMQRWHTSDPIILRSPLPGSKK